MKKILLLIITLPLLTGCINNSLPLKKTVALDSNWKQAQEPYSGQVVCTLKSSATADFEEDHIAIEASIDEKPTTITIVDIDSDTPAFFGNLGDRAELTKIDLGSKVYFMEKTGFGNINVWTLFRDKNILIGTKQYDLLGKPFGLLMMGDCLAGA